VFDNGYPTAGDSVAEKTLPDGWIWEP